MFHNEPVTVIGKTGSQVTVLTPQGVEVTRNSSYIKPYVTPLDSHDLSFSSILVDELSKTDKNAKGSFVKTTPTTPDSSSPNSTIVSSGNQGMTTPVAIDHQDTTTPVMSDDRGTITPNNNSNSEITPSHTDTNTNSNDRVDNVNKQIEHTRPRRQRKKPTYLKDYI